MQFYKITKDYYAVHAPVFWAATLDDAKDKGKEEWPSSLNEVRVELVEIEIDKATLVGIFNSSPETCGTLLRTWKYTNRGALTACPNGE